MEFLFETSVVKVGYPVTFYRILEVDTGVYFADPVNEWPREFNNQPEEFYLSKVNGVWSGADSNDEVKHVDPYFLSSIGEDIDRFYFGKKNLDQP